MDENGAFICHASGDAVLTATSTRASGVKEIAKIHVVGENTKPLSGLVIGVNAGHQKTPNYTQYPIEPGSSKTSAANKSGTRGKFSRTEEYVITLQISLKLEKLLVENGAQVVMIRRSNNVKLTNIQRSTIMNNAGCDLALNLHCDGSGSPDVSGISTYYRAKGNWVSESAAFARELQNGMLAATGAKNEGTHKSYNYMSLNYSTVPALMIEMGYLSSRVEDPLLNTDEYQMKLAQGLLNGIQSCLRPIKCGFLPREDETIKKPGACIGSGFRESASAHAPVFIDCRVERRLSVAEYGQGSVVADGQLQLARIVRVALSGGNVNDFDGDVAGMSGKAGEAGDPLFVVLVFDGFHRQKAQGCHSSRRTASCRPYRPARCPARTVSILFSALSSYHGTT